MTFEEYLFYDMGRPRDKQGDATKTEQCQSKATDVEMTEALGFHWHKMALASSLSLHPAPVVNMALTP